MSQYDLVVIGSGPGGYVAAIRGAQLGLKTACIEREPELGGTCLRIGCIPSKALLEASERFEEVGKVFSKFGVMVESPTLDLERMMQHKDSVVTANTRGVAGLFQKNKVTRIQGTGKLVGGTKVEVQNGDDTQVVEAKHIIIATGSEPASLPGVEVDGELVGTSTEALIYAGVPQHLVVIGAGAIGLELGSVWRRLGAKVTVLEYLDRILPGMDTETAAEGLKVLRKQGMDIQLGCRVTGAKAAKKGAKVSYVDSAGTEQTIKCDKVLVAVGRRAYTAGLGLENVGIEVDKRGIIPVNEHLATSAEGIYAIGDVIRGPMLAHKASEEGVAVVEYLASGYGHVNYDAIPNGVYTHPEIAAVGKTEEELNEAGIPFKKGTFPFRFNGRGRAQLNMDGFFKILAHAETDRILGAHAVGPNACDMVAEVALAIELEASAEDLGRTCHNHPTLSEAIKEAALAAWDKPI
ncbi:MAG: dihydrolipoyl dehydrogenase, partial [Myxococcales bacterium]|nr:dihydrolipoyl dehydrogenase [Myxococcales bacterium]